MFQVWLALFYSYLRKFQVFALSSPTPVSLGRIVTCTVESVYRLAQFSTWGKG